MPEHEQHHHHHDNGEPIISRRWQIATVVGNAVIGAAELAGGLAASAYSLVADGMHNGADVYTYWLQSNNLLQQHQLNQEELQRNRKIAHWILCATSAGVAAKAGVDLAMDKESVHNTLNMYAAGASVLFNGMLFGGLYRGIQRRKESGTQRMNHLEKDITKHFAFSDMPSAALALGGVYLQSKGMIGTEQMAAIASGALSAFVFRPTKKNLAHDHDHFGEADIHHHSHDQMTELPKKHRSWRKAAAGLMSLIMVGGLLGGSSPQDSQEQATHSIARHQDQKIDNVGLPIEIKADIYDCIDAELGDSVWSMATRQIGSALAEAPSNAQTNAVTLMAAHQTQLENPDLIHPDQCIEMPSQQAIEFLFISPDLVDEIDGLNTISWDETTIQDNLIGGINQYLQKNVAG